MTDTINPDHYKQGWSNGAEVIDITENLNFNRGNAVKYISRAGKKPGGSEVDDLHKAIWYIERELQRIEAPLAKTPKLHVRGPGVVVWKKSLTEFPLDDPEGDPTIWDKKSWEAGDQEPGWWGEGPYGRSYEDEGPFTDTPPPGVSE